ncbi:uncharacterized protein N7511_010019 [Penicillium nucicola]|uniref:uncharacterized protein n=1 Tax=Penicillium nucicola TaxID=1850975 RepID=UPI0025456A0E|nr:uncharacterized protein N7511_010019 [Penicillium nucicola]KAJ5748323.1 hypothetical protein N7511_010019 [Penicillium nucicola]
MPPLPGFSDNFFRDREDIVLATNALVQALEPYFSPGNARVQLPVQSGAHFDETAAQLEGFARPIWAIAGAFTGSANSTNSEILRYADRLVEGIANGVNPEHSEYWGAIEDWDQRMVEAEPISYALLIAPKFFHEKLSDRSRSHLIEWLSGLNGKIMPLNNWRWFRVFSNLALNRICGVAAEKTQAHIDADFAILDQFDLGNGWSADGIWKNDCLPDHEAYGRQADYYSGSFAIQFSQLLYCIIAAASDPDRVSRYRDQARKFAGQFWRFFDENGAAIPFGRSLTYRFAMGAFYAAFALAKCYDSSNPYTCIGFIKGMLLRHLRWWASHSTNVFAADGTLTIGYLYPNMFMCEDYNSPQSPYWAMKSFVVLGLEADDEFWAASEIPHPLSLASSKLSSVSGIKFLPAPSQILCDHPQGQHHFMLSSGQFCRWPLKATQSKYSKFAYSSAFGFSVPTGGLLSQLAPDNTLSISRDDGESWTTRWETIGNPQAKTIISNGMEMQCLQSVWKPWKSSKVEIESTLIPPCNDWPDWHVRLHRIRSPGNDSDYSETLDLVEGGFAIQAKHPRRMGALNDDWRHTSESEANMNASECSLTLSHAGASGVKNILPFEGSTKGIVLKSDPNTNLIEPRAMIPTIQHRVELYTGNVAMLATAVFAISNGKKHFTRTELFQKWCEHPRLTQDMLRQL